MKCRNLLFLSLLSCLAAVPARANWEYAGIYVGDGTYMDDGSRFTMSVRGGASFGYGSIKNNIGELTPLYYINDIQTEIMPYLAYEQCRASGECSNFSPAGYINLGNLPATQNFEAFAFAAGASVGWTLPNAAQWRIEAGWDHIAQSEYNSSPFVRGMAELFSGAAAGISAEISSGAVQSTVATDIISVMAFYDFYDGIQKPMRTVIPYVGFGVGYADIKTVLNMSDPYGDLSSVYELGQYGERASELDAVSFYRSETNSSNVAALAALGLSYGITQSIFFDFGARVAYVPKIRWTLSNSDGTLHRDWFSTNGTIYANIMLGVRFEF